RISRRTVVRSSRSARTTTEKSMSSSMTVTGKAVRKRRLGLPPDAGGATGHGWRNAEEYVVRIENPETGDFHGYYRVVPDSGKAARMRDLNEDSDTLVVLGSV